MVAERVISITIAPEALLFGIIVMVHLTAHPVRVALYAEMVVALGSQSAAAGIGLKQTLGKRNTGRDTVFLHLLYSHTVVSGYICRVSILVIYA